MLQTLTSRPTSVALSLAAVLFATPGSSAIPHLGGYWTPCYKYAHAGFCDPGNPYAGQTIHCSSNVEPPGVSCMVDQPKYTYVKGAFNACVQIEIVGYAGRTSCDPGFVYATVQEWQCDDAATDCSVVPKGDPRNVLPGCATDVLSGSPCTGTYVPP
jgi:hypothetical protein